MDLKREERHSKGAGGYLTYQAVRIILAQLETTHGLLAD